MINLSQEPSANLLPTYLAWAESRWVNSLMEAQVINVASLSVMTLGLAGEVSEVAEVVALWAYSRQRQDVTLPKELGDVFYYWARLSKELGYTLPTAYAPGVLVDPIAKLDAEPPVLLALRLVSAQGKVTESVKKFIRDGSLNREKLENAMLDVYVLWQELCAECGHPWRDILQANIDKIEGRVSRGTLRGSGDHR